MRVGWVIGCGRGESPTVPQWPPPEALACSAEGSQPNFELLQFVWSRPPAPAPHFLEILRRHACSQ